MPASKSSKSKIQELYVAYYGRPGDPAGIDYWAEELEAAGGDLSAMIQAFGNSQEYLEGIGADPTANQVTILYQQMFSRDPEQAGLDYWVAEIDSGRRTLSEAALAIAEGAQGDDRVTLDNKIIAANYFTEQVAVTGAPYVAEDIPAAKQILSGVTVDPESIVESFALTDAWIADSIENGGTSYDLTIAVDTIIGTYANDTVNGLDENNPLTDTLNDGDSFDGAGGMDTLKILSDTSDLTLSKIQLVDVEKLEVVNAKESWKSVDIAGHDFNEISLDVGGKMSGGLAVSNLNASTAVTLGNIEANNLINVITFNADSVSSEGSTAVTIHDVDFSAGDEFFAVEASFNAADTVNTTVNLLGFDDDNQGNGGFYDHYLNTGAIEGVVVNAVFNIENLLTADLFDVGFFVDQAGGSVNNITVNLTNTDNVDVLLEFDNLAQGTSATDVVNVNLDSVANSNGMAYFSTTDAETLNVNVMGDSELQEISNYYNNDLSPMGNVVVNLNAAAKLHVDFWDFNDDSGITENTQFNISGSGDVSIATLDDGSSNLTVKGASATGDISIYEMAEEIIKVETGSGRDYIVVGSSTTSVITNDGDDYVDTNGKDFSVIGAAILGGGRGYDTIAIDDASHFDLTTANIRSFEALDVSGGRGVYDISVAASLKDIIAFEGIDESVTIDQAVSQATLTLNAFASEGKSINMMQKNGAGLNDILKLNLNAIDITDNQNIDGETDAIVIAAEYETVKLASEASTVDTSLMQSDYTNSVDLDAAEMTTLTVSGQAKLEIMLTDASALEIVDASNNTGGINVDLSNAGSTGISFKGSSASDTVTVSDNDINLIQGNGGADVIGLGGGTDAIRYVSASDSKLILTESEMSGFDIINDFSSASTDVIQLFAALGLGSNEARFAMLQKGGIGGTTPADMQDFIGDGLDFFADTRVDRATAFANDGTDGYLFVDGNNDGNFTAVDDVVIQLAGVTTLSISDVQFG